MGTGEEPQARRDNGGRRRKRLGGDEEYVAEEEEEEDYAEELSASSAGEEGEDSDAEYVGEEEEEEDEVDTPRPKLPVKGGVRGQKGKADLASARSRRRKYEEDEDYEEEVDEDEEEEEEEEEEEDEEEEEEEEDMSPVLRPKSVAKCGRRGRYMEQSLALKRLHKRRRGEEEEDEEEEEEEEEEEDMSTVPRPKRLAKCGWNVELATAAERSHQRRRSEKIVEEYHTEEEEDMTLVSRPKRLSKFGSGAELAAAAERSHQTRRNKEVEEYHTEEEEDMSPVPRPKWMRKYGSDVEPAAAKERSHYQSCSKEKVEVYHTEEEEDMSPIPRPKRLAKCGSDVEPTAAAEGSHQRRLSNDEVEEYHTEEEEDMSPVPRPKWMRKYGLDVEPAAAEERSHHQSCSKEEVEVYRTEEEEDMSPIPRPNWMVKCGSDVEPAAVVERSHQRRRNEEDVDFDPDLDEEEDEVDEDIDFNPETDEDEDEFVDEEEDEFGAMHARKVTVKNQVKRRSASKRRALKKKKNRGSTVSRRKVTSAKAKKSAPIRRRRKRSAVDDYEDEDDFIVDDEVVVNRHPRKKARTGSGRESEKDPQVSVVGEDAWPDVESETSDFDFVTSDEEPNDVETPVVEPITVKKRKKRRIAGSESSSDSEFLVSDKELDDLRGIDTLKALPIAPTQTRRISVTRNGEDKGKKKEKPEVGRPICGICLSEEHRTTIQGVLNCCSHYFCFACIMEWSRVESRCPLCKQRFTTITKLSKVDLGLGLRKAVIKVEERDQVYQPTEEEIRRWLYPYENVVCIECNQCGDDSLMLLCDICDSSAHTYCVGLGREVPEGNWYCGGCRLSDEGPSYTRVHHTAGHERQNFRNVDSSSLGFGTAAPSGTFGRPPSISPQHSLQGIDLNLSPREAPGEIHPAESQASTDNASTPSGRRATLSGRRQIHRYIQMLLSRPRPPSRSEMYHNIAQHSGGVPRTEPNQYSLCSSSEANTSHNISDGIQNQRNGLSFVQAHSNFTPCMSLDGDDFQQIEGVKSNLRNT